MSKNKYEVQTMTWVGDVTRTEINARKYSRIQDNNKTHMEDPGKGRKIILKFISKKYECKCVECTSCGQGRVQRLSILKVINVTSDTIYISRGYDNRVLLYLTVLISIYCRYKSTATKLITLQISHCTLPYNIVISHCTDLHLLQIQIYCHKAIHTTDITLHTAI